MEKFEQPSQGETFERLRTLFDEAEATFEHGGRDEAKPLLGKLYSGLSRLNKPAEDEVNTLAVWNPKGDLTEEQFNELNLRRKKLSNAIGIMTKSGEIRHDLNKL